MQHLDTEHSYFIRVKGRVQGPYEWGKLKQLVRRRHLSRINYISADRESWTRAGNFQNLFETENSAAEKIESRVSEGSARSVAPDLDSEWYVEQQGQSTGPLSFNALKNGLESGQYNANNLVWCEGMQDWTAAASIPDFNMTRDDQAAAAISDSGTVQNEGVISNDLANLIFRSRIWILISGFLLGLLSAASLIAGFYEFINGIKNENSAEVLRALLLLILFISLLTLSVSSFYLQGSVVRLKHTTTFSQLRSVFTRTRRLAMLATVVLLILTVAIAILPFLF